MPWCGGYLHCRCSVANLPRVILWHSPKYMTQSSRNRQCRNIWDCRQMSVVSLLPASPLHPYATCPHLGRVIASSAMPNFLSDIAPLRPPFPHMATPEIQRTPAIQCKGQAATMSQPSATISSPLMTLAYNPIQAADPHSNILCQVFNLLTINILSSFFSWLCMQQRG